MYFKNAYKGIGNIITAEFLSILATITGAATLLLGLFTYGAIHEKIQEVIDATVGPLTVIGLATLVIALVAFFLNIAGLIKAGKDEVEFKKALLYILSSVILTTVASFFTEKLPWLETVSSIVSKLTYTFAMMHVVYGIAELADQLFNDKMIRSGKSVTVIILITFIIWLAAKLVVTFLFKDPKSNINVILSLASLAMGIVQTFAYIIYLCKGRKLLRGK